VAYVIGNFTLAREINCSTVLAFSP